MSPADYLPVFLEEAQDTLRSLQETLRGLEQRPDALYRAVELSQAFRRLAGSLKSPRILEKSLSLDSWLLSLYHQQEPLTPHTATHLMAIAEDIERELLGKTPVSSDHELQVSLVSHCRLKGLRARQILDVLAEFGTVVDTRPDAASLEGERFGKDFTVCLRSAASLFEIRRRLLSIGDVASLEPVSTGRTPRLPVSKPHPIVPLEQGLRDLAALQGKEIDFSIKQLQLLPTILVPLVKLISKEAVSAIDTPPNRIRQGCSPRGAFSLEVFQEGCKLRIELVFTGRILPTEERQNSQKSATLAQLFSALEPHGGTSKIRTSGGKTYISLRWPNMPSSLDAVLFELNGIPFAFPLQWVDEVIDLSEHPIYQGKLFLRGEEFPVVGLQTLFELPVSQPASVGFTVRIQGKRLGLIAERMLGQKSLVPKPISRLLGSPSFLEAASILEDGRIAFWLDLLTLGEVA